MVISGVIRPPPDIRAVADKTALFVAKNGRAFEERILNSEKGKTPKFAFLHSSNPFHAYYEQRIRFYEEGGTEKEDKKEDAEEKKEDEIAGGKPKASEQERKQDKAQKASAVDPVAKALLLQRSKIRDARATMEEEAKKEDGAQLEGLEPPAALRWVSAVAPHISPVQLETIKLVAQFVALDGKGGPLLQDLALREWNNPTFGFLQPRHGHFAYFSALVDGYRHILSTWSKPDAADLSSTDVDKCLDIAAYRAEYDRDTAERERAAKEENGGALSGAALIDWHDFVVVETIEFPREEVVKTLPPPPAKAAGVDQDVGAMEESDDEEGETIRVVPSYTPKVVSTQAIAKEASRTHMIDPITGKSVPIAVMPEHMRIQLLDPKWAEEKKKFMDKQKESNLVSGEAIAENINRLTQQARGDSSAPDLSAQASSKRSLEELNQSARQPQLPPPGPTLPAMQLPMPGVSWNPPPPPPFPVPPPPAEAAGLPAAKRARVDGSGPIPPPPQPMPPPPTGVMPPPPTGAMPPLPGAPLLPPPPEAAPPAPTTKEFMSESDFSASLDSPTVTLTIQVPNDPSNSGWNFNGQTVSLSVDVMSKIKDVKTELQSHVGGMPTNKMQLKDENTGFLKDGNTLAHFNIGPTATLELIPKTRGRRK